MSETEQAKRCPQRLYLVGGRRSRCKFRDGHRGNHWYLDDPRVLCPAIDPDSDRQCEREVGHESGHHATIEWAD